MLEWTTKNVEKNALYQMKKKRIHMKCVHQWSRMKSAYYMRNNAMLIRQFIWFNENWNAVSQLYHISFTFCSVSKSFEKKKSNAFLGKAECHFSSSNYIKIYSSRWAEIQCDLRIRAFPKCRWIWLPVQHPVSIQSRHLFT